MLHGIHLRKNINLIEGVQRRATKLVPSLKNLSYKDRLIKLKLPTLSYRRLRGDMIEVYKIMYCYDKNVTNDLCALSENSHNTRGHSKKLEHHRSVTDIRKYSFNSRVVNHWNHLPDNVINSKNMYSFERKLDKAWQNQEVKYDHTTTLIYSQIATTSSSDLEIEEI